ncbi:unnamed protein product, partial [Symbiodinium sp. KB8]
MLLNRLKKNRGRLSDLSEAMQKMVLSDDRKQQKILKQLVMKNNGDLTKVEMDTKDLVEANDSELALERQTPMTKTQVELELLYGAEAEKVMSHKRSLGLIRQDLHAIGSSGSDTPAAVGTAEHVEAVATEVTRTTTLETQLSARPFAEKLLEEIKGDLKKFR